MLEKDVQGHLVMSVCWVKDMELSGFTNLTAGV